MAQLLTKKENNQSWDFQAELKSTWSEHLRYDNSGIYESSMQHGISCPTKCCSSRTFMVEVRKRK